jgi:hypothetical protein
MKTLEIRASIYPSRLLKRAGVRGERGHSKDGLPEDEINAQWC